MCMMFEVMTHRYKVTTNCQVIGPFQVAKLIPMLNSLRYVSLLSSLCAYSNLCQRTAALLKLPLTCKIGGH